MRDGELGAQEVRPPLGDPVDVWRRRPEYVPKTVTAPLEILRLPDDYWSPFGVPGEERIALGGNREALDLALHIRFRVIVLVFELEDRLRDCVLVVGVEPLEGCNDVFADRLPGRGGDG